LAAEPQRARSHSVLCKGDDDDIRVVAKCSDPVCPVGRDARRRPQEPRNFRGIHVCVSDVKVLKRVGSGPGWTAAP
ncbi:MAG: hypothetical protein AB8G99_06665, partial [Planctomycetaceae bacterium]